MKFLAIILFCAVMMLSAMTVCNAQDTPKLPYSFQVKWDISKKDNLLVQDFVVNKTAPFSATELILEQAVGQHTLFKDVTLQYSVGISFKGTKHFSNGEEAIRFSNSEEGMQVKDFEGDRHFDYYTNDPINPVLVLADSFDSKRQAIERASQGKYHIKYANPGTTIPVTIKIEKIDGHNIEVIVPEKTINTTALIERGYYNTRLITDKVTLPSGKYRVSVSVPNEVKLPANIETSLVIFAPGGVDQANTELNYKNKQPDIMWQSRPVPDYADFAYRQQAEEKAYSSPINQTISWNNPLSGHNGSVTPINDTPQPSVDAKCRQFKHTGAADGQTQTEIITACQNKDGKWRDPIIYYQYDDSVAMFEDHEDVNRRKAVDEAYTAPINKTITWYSFDRARQGSITPIREETLSDVKCRQFKLVKIGRGQTQTETNITCMNLQHGTWDEAPEIARRFHSASPIQTEMTYQQALNMAYAAPINETISWNNLDTGQSGYMVPIQEGTQTSTGNKCRLFRQGGMPFGVGQERPMASCQNKDGVWNEVTFNPGFLK